MTEAEQTAKEPAALERVPEVLREPIDQYAALLREIAGDKAKALTIFGAAAAGSFDPSLHTVRNVLVLEKVDLDVLRRLAEHGPKLGKARISAPLIMTPDYIQASLDTFPLELIEVQQNHLTLFGDDYFANLAFEESHVRLQCERELKAILIGLRQGLLAAAGRDKVLAELETNVADSLARTLRGLLWLKGQRDAKPAIQVLTAVEQITSRVLPGVRAALDATGVHGWQQFEDLYHDVETLGEVADAW